ncbi:extracellular solute-binding protein [Microbacterium sp. CFH 90308]|uniref:Extracellular solute-binding protein n=1 Tax=Microbacterium salsuginis TaxID=2722803 RepID=A0ABX1KAW8_9MICO|nr:extracellular solute-binding protein [Microbacterium sp. CFH 90308]NLP84178.1 extracellular solute-binding protein [Microbacterium sp. CFH 90308]
MSPTTKRYLRGGAILGAAAMTVASLAACSAGSDNPEDTVTITLAGPNQWNADPSSFGPEWEALVAAFEEAEPNIKVETVVLPLAEFATTLSTQLSAGTAPELIFNQAPHTPDQVVALDEYLDQPNPYVEGNEKWVDVFNADYFGPTATNARNAAGNYEFIPFNLYISGLYYNADAFAEAGIDTPPTTFDDFIEACGDLKDAGYIPLAVDNSYASQNYVYSPIRAMLQDKYFDEWNVFAPDGSPGTSKQIGAKGFAHAVLTGALDATTTPEIAETMTLMKTVFDECGTPNWSGVTSTGAAFTGGEDFLGGEAAIAFGSNFAATNLTDVDWEYGTMPFPTITKSDSALSSGREAQSGASVGGTSYMIPATTEGEKLDAAVKFLQFASAPEHIQPWLDETGGIPALADAEPAPGLEGLMTGSWFESPRVPARALIPRALAGQAVYTGWLTGSKSLQDQLTELQGMWVENSHELAEDGGWTEDWATK